MKPYGPKLLQRNWNYKGIDVGSVRIDKELNREKSLKFDNGLVKKVTHKMLTENLKMEK